MKFLITLLLSGFVGFATPNKKIPITITIDNIKYPKGNIQIGIYKDAKHFLDEGKEFKLITKKVIGNTLTFTLNLSDENEYAFAIYHDRNSDKKCNRNFLGIPTEDYGFSKIYKQIFYKPKFKDCKINLKKQKKIHIKLI